MGVWGVSTQYESYDYVQVDKPASAIEGETWYDMDADAAKVFVDDAGTTEEMNVTDHGQLSNVSAGQHRSDSNIRTVVDGANISIGGDADTVDGNHASQLGGTTPDVQRYSVEGPASGTWSPANGETWVALRLRVSDEYQAGATMTLHFSDGTSNSLSNWSSNKPHIDLNHSGRLQSIDYSCQYDDVDNYRGTASAVILALQ